MIKPLARWANLPATPVHFPLNLGIDAPPPLAYTRARFPKGSVRGGLAANAVYFCGPGRPGEGVRP